MKAILQYRASPGFQQRIAETAPDWLSVHVIEETDRISLDQQIGDTEILLHVLEPVTKDVMERAPGLRLIQKIGVGINTIDVAAAKQHGIAVCNMPGTNSRAVAEMALTLMLAALRGISYFDPAMRRGEGWQASTDRFDGLGEICGRSVGLVGYGASARLLSPILSAMGATVFYTATAPKADADAQWRPLPDLLAESDIVSLHLPLTPATHRMIDSTAIARMKPGAVLINTSRGDLVDESALIRALRSGHLRSAGLDVVSMEPASADNPLFNLPNVVVTPHIAWLTPETLDRSLEIAFENCRRLRDHEDLMFRVA